MRRLRQVDQRRLPIPGYLNASEFNRLKKIVERSGVNSRSKYCRLAVLQESPSVVRQSLTFEEMCEISRYLLIFHQAITQGQVTGEPADLKALLQQLQETRLRLLQIAME